MEEYIRDVVCSVIANECSKDIIDKVLCHFLPNHKEINLDYCNPPDNLNYQFKSEDEMIRYFIDHKNLSQTFYWNQDNDNPHKIMVGASILSDDKLVMSLTLNGTKQIYHKYLVELKHMLHSDIGVISYVDPPEYKNGADFIRCYQSTTKPIEDKYEFPSEFWKNIRRKLRF